MFRLIGFLAGSLAAIVALFTLIGTPRFQLNSENDDDRFRVAVQQLKDKQPTLPDPTARQEIPMAPGIGEQSIGEQTATPALLASVNALPAETASVDSAPNETTTDSDQASSNPAPEDEAAENDTPADPPPENAVAETRTEPLAIADTPVPSEISTAVAATPDSDELVWQTFWNPFRSELAAEGFVRRLESVTGLDYRVERIRNGVYEVTFAYYSDAERDAYLTQIATATGLDLSDALR